MPRVSETVSYLEMTDPADVRPGRPARVAFTLERAPWPHPELSRECYLTVGADWQWTDRRDWSVAQWAEWAEAPGHELWLATVHGERAGYFELQGPVDGGVELAYFGLLPAWYGLGLGGELLTRALARAWAKGPQRVWVHTSSLDHPAALSNYQARGLRLVRQETAWVDKPA